MQGLVCICGWACFGRWPSFNCGGWVLDADFTSESSSPVCLNSITLQRAAPPWVFGFRFRTSDSSFSVCCLGLKLHTSESSFPFWFLVAGCTPQRAASLWVYGCRLHISNGAFNRRVHTSESSCLLGFWLQASHLREQLPFCFVFWVSASHLREQLPFGFWSSTGALFCW